MELQTLTGHIVHQLDKHLARDIRVLDVEGLTSIADRFIIASGGSVPQVKSLADYVEDALAAQGEHPLREEGYDTAQWILLDYGAVVVHIFLNTTREFYDLERLWVDAPNISIEQFLDSEDA